MRIVINVILNNSLFVITVKHFDNHPRHGWWRNFNMVPKVCQYMSKAPDVSRNHVESWNSKGRSVYSFDSIYKIYFAAFLHRSFEVIQIWSTHKSKALIFYFGMKKVLSPIFERFVGNRQIY